MTNVSSLEVNCLCNHVYTAIGRFKTSENISAVRGDFTSNQVKPLHYYFYQPSGCSFTVVELYVHDPVTDTERGVLTC